MNELFLFLTIFFGIIGITRTVSIIYTFAVRSVSRLISRKDEDDVKIWMKP